MSKSELVQMMQLMQQFIQGLTADQFNNLIKGNGVIKYEQCKVKENTEFDQLKEAIIQKAQTQLDVEKVLYKQTKKFLAAFCKYYNMEVTTKHTKGDIYKIIARHFHIDIQETNKEDAISEFSKIEAKLQQLESVDEALNYLMMQEAIRSKSSLIQFAKTLDVYITQKQRKEEILNRIVDSIVGVKLRGRALRVE